MNISGAGDQPGACACRVTEIIKLLRRAAPDAHIVIQGLLPRGSAWVGPKEWKWPNRFTKPSRLLIRPLRSALRRPDSPLACAKATAGVYCFAGVHACRLLHVWQTSGGIPTGVAWHYCPYVSKYG